MNTLREAAQAALEHWDKVSGIFRMTTETNRLRAALAQPETTAEPVAWAVMCDGNAVQTFLTETAANLIAENRREQTRGRGFDWQTTPLYAHPPQPCAQRYALTECKALAQPEAEAQPVAWLNRHHAAMVTQDHATAVAMGFTTPLYAHPPRDEWRPASEPPDSDRLVIVWVADDRSPSNGGYFCTDSLRPSRANPDARIWASIGVTHWRDVQPPTESTAKCQRIEGSGQICGLTPPCPDCGPSLIDVPEGS